MAALGAVGTRSNVLPTFGGVIIELVSPSTMTHSDTIAIDLGDYGCKNLHGIIGFVESTTGSIVVQEQPTTANTSGVVVITPSGSAGAKVRTYYLFAYD